MNLELKAPETWELPRIIDIADILMGQSPPSDTYNLEGRGMPFFQGKAEFTELHPKAEKWCTAPNKIALPEDILVSVRAPVGAVNIADQKCCIGRGLASIRYKGNNKFIFYYLKLMSRKLDEQGTGTTFRAISGEILKEFPVPFPPEFEQVRIVSKIEELFSDLDKGIESLKTAQQQLKVYRQAVLKWAFEGKLTENWRRQRDYLTPAKELLKSIANEKSVQGGKQLKSLEFVGLYEIPDTQNLPELPDKWKWVKFQDVCERIFDGTHFSPKNYPVGKYKYITAKNIKESGIDLSDITYVSEEDHRNIYSRCDVKKGDVLYIKDGATTGRATVNNLEEEFSLLSSVGVFRVNSKFINPAFLSYYLNAQITRNRMLAKIAGVAITRLTLTKLNDAFFILTSLEEQNQIIQEIESRLSVCDKVEETIVTSLKQAEALRQSILKKAFEGKLVPQDPDDEPASELLKRMQAENTATVQEKKTTKSKKATGK